MITSKTSSIPSPAVSTVSLLLFLVIFTFSANPAQAQKKQLIAASGGASGVLSDTLPAITMAGLADIDFIELNLSVTGDDELIVFPQPLLNGLTNVDELFPDRGRDNGLFYVTDFTLQEIRQLRRTDSSLNNPTDNGPKPPSLGISTLEETLALLQTISYRQNSTIGIAPNIRFTAEYKKAGKDISRQLIAMLAVFGYNGQHPVLLQSDDGDELQRIKEELLPLYAMDSLLVQRVSPATPGSDLKQQPDNSWIFTRLGLRMVSSYADAIVLPANLLPIDQPAQLPPGFLDDARTLGLDLFVSVDWSSSTPTNTNSQTGPESWYDERLAYYYKDLGLNGVLTPDHHVVNGYFERLAAAQAEEIKKHEAENEILPISVFLQRQAMEKAEKAGNTSQL